MFHDVNSPSLEIDRILLDGRRIYDNFLLQSDKQYPRYLSHNELPHDVNVFRQMFNVHIYEGMYYGVVGHDSCPDSSAVGLPIALQNAEHQSNFKLFTANQVTISIFNDQNQYFLFDSHARDTYGLPDHHGFAITMPFQNFQDLVNYLYAVYSNMCNLSPVTIAVHMNNTNTNSYIAENITDNYSYHNYMYAKPLKDAQVENSYGNDMQDNGVVHISPIRSYSKQSDNYFIENSTCMSDMGTSYTLRNYSENNIPSCVNHTCNMLPSEKEYNQFATSQISSDHSYFKKSQNMSLDIHKTSGSKHYFKTLKGVPANCRQCCKDFLFPENIAHFNKAIKLILQ
jgi:hypothetical protein